MGDLAFYINGFVIIDLVPEDELQTGKRLEDEILDLTLYEKRQELFCKRVKCKNEEEVIAVLEGIQTHLISKSEVPIIHIEGHA